MVEKLLSRISPVSRKAGSRDNPLPALRNNNFLNWWSRRDLYALPAEGRMPEGLSASKNVLGSPFNIKLLKEQLDKLI